MEEETLKGSCNDYPLMYDIFLKMFEELTMVLNEMGKEIVDVYRYKLQENDVNATHTLSQSLNYQIKSKDRVFDLYIDLQDYWYYVEYGRKAGVFPNINSIREWIKVKPVIPYKTNGKIPSLNQLTYLIGRSIKENGIKGKHLLYTTVDSVWDAYEDKLSMAIEKDIEKIIDMNIYK